VLKDLQPHILQALEEVERLKKVEAERTAELEEMICEFRDVKSRREKSLADVSARAASTVADGTPGGPVQMSGGRKAAGVCLPACQPACLPVCLSEPKAPLPCDPSDYSRPCVFAFGRKPDT
jgi:hypothetical protein